MPYINVDVEVDVNDVLPEVSERDLIAELDRRAKKAGKESFFPSEPRHHAMIRQAIEERDWRKIEEMAEADGIFFVRQRRAA